MSDGLDLSCIMDLALEEAFAAAARGEVPVGAVLVGADGRILARDGNRILERTDPTAHAEILVIRAGALGLGSERLVGSTLVSTLEPCAMCAGAIAMARVATVVYGAEDPKGGAVGHGPRFFAQPTCHHRPEIVKGLKAEPSARLLKSFFKARRTSA